MMGMEFSDSDDEEDVHSNKTPQEETKDAGAYNFGMQLKAPAKKFSGLGKSVKDMTLGIK